MYSYSSLVSPCLPMSVGHCRPLHHCMYNMNTHLCKGTCLYMCVQITSQHYRSHYMKGYNITCCINVQYRIMVLLVSNCFTGPKHLPLIMTIDIAQSHNSLTTSVLKRGTSLYMSNNTQNTAVAVLPLTTHHQQWVEPLPKSECCSNSLHWLSHLESRTFT